MYLIFKKIIFYTWTSSRETNDLVIMSVTEVKNYLSLFPLQKFQKQEGKLGSQLLKSGQTRTTTQKPTTQLKLNGVEPFVF